MNLQDDIFQTVLYAKCTAGCWASDFIAKEERGEELGCCEMRLMILVNWIKTMEDYYCDNFSTNGNITPDLPCLTSSDAQYLLSKIKSLIA